MRGFFCVCRGEGDGFGVFLVCWGFFVLVGEGGVVLFFFLRTAVYCHPWKAIVWRLVIRSCSL